MLSWIKKWFKYLQKQTELTVEEVSSKYPQINKNRIYYLMRKEDKRFAQCIIPNRKLIYIDEEKLLLMLQHHPDLAKGRLHTI